MRRCGSRSSASPGARARRCKTSAGSDPEVVALYADSLWAMGLFDEAEEQYRAALALNAESSRARLGVARSLATRSRLPEALEEALRARAADPSDYQIHATLGDIYTRLYRFEDAANAFTEYKACCPRRKSPSAVISEAQIKFLRSFKGRTPLAIRDDGGGRGAHGAVPARRRTRCSCRAVINGRYSTELVLDTGAERIGLSERDGAARGCPAREHVGDRRRRRRMATGRWRWRAPRASRSAR